MAQGRVNIQYIKKYYNFKWGIDDFLVSDEQHPIVRQKGPIRVDGYIIGICLKGTLSLELNHKVYHGKEHFMLVTTPMQYFQFTDASPDCRLRFIIFSKRFLAANNINQDILEKFKFTHPNALPVVKVEEREGRNMVREFELICKRFTDVDHPFHKEITSNLLLVLLYDFEQMYSKHFKVLQTKNVRSKELTIQFTKLVQKHFKEQHSLDFYAKKLFVTPKYLTETIKEETGKTACTLINEALILEASTLLQKPNMSVKEVASCLKFSDQSTFGKFFKRLMGRTPKAYVKDHGYYL